MVQFLENEYGSKKENIIAAIGPSICRSCYEVSEDVADEFKKELKDMMQKNFWMIKGMENTSLISGKQMRLF